MCKVLHENCNKSLAKDRSLPINSFLVTYILDDKTAYDIVICHKRSDIFDMYWDKHRSNLKIIEWTEGRISPKMWGYQPKGDKKKK
jgi:hypothetical protein